LGRAGSVIIFFSVEWVHSGPILGQAKFYRSTEIKRYQTIKLFSMHGIIPSRNQTQLGKPPGFEWQPP